MIAKVELLTVDEVAAICRVHPVTVRRHIASGRLRAVRAGHGLRVRRDDLDSYLQHAAATPPTGQVARTFTRVDSLWDIVGMIDEPGEAWVSADKRRALAEAYTPRQ